MNEEKVGIKTPEYVSLQFQLAGLGSRTAAFIIDQLILTLVNIAILIVVLILLVGTPSSALFFATEMESMTLAITIIALFLINWGYYFAYEYFSGGKTIGKKIIGIRVIQENGHSITLLSSFIRNFLRIIDMLPANYFIGILMVFFHSKHKRVGDLVAGTIVVHERHVKKKKKQTPLEKEIEKRGISKTNLGLNEWSLNSIGTKEWKLIQTYCNRVIQLPEVERIHLTKEVADIVFPKIGLQVENKNTSEIENLLFVLYLTLKDEWDFEL